MTRQENWQKDPLVIAQDAIWPASWRAAHLLAAFRAEADADIDTLLAPMDEAVRMLRHKVARLMTGYGVAIGPEDQAIFNQTAERIIECRNLMRQFCASPQDAGLRAAASTALFDRMQPAVMGALNHLRKLFISFVIEQQRTQAARTDTAISGLDKISKQIFFISINASVEAARVGDAGRGFLQISTDIRALSQSAQDATRDLSEAVAGNSRAI